MFRWLFLATLSLVLLLQLRGFDRELRTSDTPHGIVGYELAWSAERANPMLRVWRNAGTLEQAKVSLGVDFAFLLAYPFMFASGIALLVRTRAATQMIRAGLQLRRLVLLCIPLDALENVLLWRMIDQGASDGAMHLATIAAALKFVLVIAAALWCLAALVLRVARRLPAE